MELSPLLYKREKVFWILSAVFLSSMTLLNVVGITKFINLWGLSVAVGVLPYPLTFLCTDIISEIYGKKRAHFLVLIGLFINFFILGLMALGQALPSVPLELQPPWQTLSLSKEVFLASGGSAKGAVELFTLVASCTQGAVFASMLAYMLAQFFDVSIFHYVKEKTKGKHLWLRNNVSTLLSQLIDSVVVIAVTFGALFLRGEMPLKTLFFLFLSNYAFKVLAALLDTPFFIFFSLRLKKYLELEHEV